MSFEVIATDPFERKLKKLLKRHRSIKKDLFNVISELEKNPTIGIPLGNNCYKIRMAISSKGRGKSGGARLITLVRVVNKHVFLLDLYDKSDQDTISESELQYLLEILNQSSK